MIEKENVGKKHFTMPSGLNINQPAPGSPAKKRRIKKEEGISPLTISSNSDNTMSEGMSICNTVHVLKKKVVGDDFPYFIYMCTNSYMQ